MELSTASIALRLLAVAGLVAANALFVAAEFAIVTTRRTRIAQLVRQGHRGAGLVQHVINSPEPYVAATQLGITMASLALGWIGTPTLTAIIEPLVSGLPTGLRSVATHTVSATLAYALITVLHITFGELAPKSMALWSAESTAMFVLPPTVALSRLFRPVIWTLNSLANGSLRLIGLRAPAGRHVAYQREELVMLVGEARRAGVLEREEASLVRRVFRLTDRTASEVMVPRTAIAAVRKSQTVRDAVDLVRQRGFTRLPVIGDDLDLIVGAVHAKDLLISLADGRGERPVGEVARPVLYVPETKPVVDLLEEMRHGRSQLAVVLEEYGSTAGIVTIEDLLEEIVGEIPGEYQPRPPVVHLKEPDRIVVDASIDLATLNELFGLALSSDQANTLGGFIFYHLGAIPEPGTRFSLGGLEFTVETVIGRRIGRVDIRRKPQAS
jgi:CBS domain containing-hemolysin-like protein